MRGRGLLDFRSLESKMKDRGVREEDDELGEESERDGLGVRRGWESVCKCGCRIC